MVVEIGQEALVAPDELAAVVGAPADDFDQRVAYVGFGRPLDERGDVDPRAVRLVVAVVVLFVLAPLVVLIATASRLSARTTERRLAALRVLGLSAKRTRRVLAAETSVVATIGLSGNSWGSTANGRPVTGTAVSWDATVGSLAAGWGEC